jgi:dihydrofolate reductase
MRRLVVSMHTSLDGFVAGPNGEMNWIHVDDEMFDAVGQLTNEADTALYGRVTWQMMDAYWPTAADQPGASKHDIEHAAWYKSADKVVVSHSMQEEKEKTSFINNDVVEKIKELKHREGKNIQVFGSPSICHLLMQHNLVDEYWLFVNPILLGEGIPMFRDIKTQTGLELINVKKFGKGVVGLHYRQR